MKNVYWIFKSPIHDCVISGFTIGFSLDNYTTRKQQKRKFWCLQTGSKNASTFFLHLNYIKFFSKNVTRQRSRTRKIPLAVDYIKLVVDRERNDRKNDKKNKHKEHDRTTENDMCIHA